MLPLFYHTTREMGNISRHTVPMTENQIYDMIFVELIKNYRWGYGKKRINLNLKDSITEKIPFSGFGYKDKEGILYVGVRMWLDQGDHSKLKQYDKNYTIMSHFMSMIQEFDYNYRHKFK